MPSVSLVLTVIGADRPGLVERLATTVSSHNGNWQESRMAHLGGRFAGILHVEVQSDQAERLQAALRGLADEGLQTIIEVDADAVPPLEKTPTLRLELVGHDRPGIVREITEILAQQQANVEELETAVTAAANTGQNLFRAEIRVQLPADGSIRHLQEALEGVAADMMVDIRSQA